MTIPHVISLGAGVQSSTLALMAMHGEITPKPVGAIFADTKAEPPSVYTWLDWLETQLDFPVYRISAGSLEVAALKERITSDGRRFSQTALPVFTRNEDGSNGMVKHRSCTVDYKVKPIQRQVRRLAGIRRGQKTVGVIQWLGISLDEVSRMKPSRVPWAEHRFPLVDLGVRRSDCKAWMRAHGYPEPPRSACVFCPYHNNREWRRLRDQEPKAFARAVAFERGLQAIKARSDNFVSVPYLHYSRVNLDEVDLRTAEERGQLNLFENECEGLCGV